MGGSGGGRRLRQVVDGGASGPARSTTRCVRDRMMRVVTAERILEWVRDRYVGGTLWPAATPPPVR